MEGVILKGGWRGDGGCWVDTEVMGSLGTDG